MNRILFCTCLFFISLWHPQAQAQVNTDSIGQASASTEGRAQYKILVEKLSRSDSTLQRKDFLALYYGSVYQPTYNLDLIDSIEYRIKQYNLLQEFFNAYELADTLLAFHPVSITAYFEKSFSCYALKRTDEEAMNRQKYRFFIKCVLSSGDGGDTPFVVVSYNDAIEVLKYLQVKYKDIQELDNGLLVASLSKKYQGINKIYFHIPTLK